MSTENPLTDAESDYSLSFNTLVEQNNRVPEWHIDGVYVVRTSLSGADGYYIGSTKSSVWKRCDSHAKKCGDWKDDAPIGHDIVGLEAAFLRFGRRNLSWRGGLRDAENLVAAAFIDRYGTERAYGGGYSDKLTPNYEFFRATPEFVSGVKNTEYEWVLNYDLKISPAFDSIMYDRETISGDKPRVWRVLSSPPLPRS